jgi:cysteine desulfuration protein SufE
MSTIEQLTIDDLVENFELLGDWEERFGYLLDLGRKVPKMDASDLTEANKVHGCQSQVWLKMDVEPAPAGPRVRFVANSDAHIVNGLIAVLMAMYNGRPAQEILAADAQAVFTRLELEEHLSPTRRNGLHAMVNRIRELAGRALGEQFGRARPDDDKPDQPHASTNGDLKAKVIDAIRKVYDPEIPVNIYELGLIYDVAVSDDGKRVNVTMTLTTPNCPEAQSIPQMVENYVAAIDEIDEVNVHITWEPMWNRDMMSDQAKLQLGLL